MRLKKVISIMLAAALAVPMVSIMPKEAKADNPIVQNIFAPDPAPMVYDDTVYVYTTHDEDETVGGFYTMLNWHVFSTKDMVNYTSHGQIWSLDDISWANDRAWAAQCIEKDGKFYLYVPVKATNSGICIGVGVSDSPTGPFVDAIGKPLVDEGDWNDIDPTVYIDDDGQAYLYFGNPQLRYVKLNDDMISYDKDLGVVKNEMTAAAFGDRGNGESSYAEGPWFYKRNTLFYMVYPAFGKTGGENISYSTSTSPTGPWTFGGVILSPNNCYTIHPGVIDYHDRSFLFYHDCTLGRDSYHRSCAVEEIFYDEDGSIPSVEQTRKGVVDAIRNLDPYQRVEAETMAWESGVEVERQDGNNCNLYSLHDGNYIKLKNVDFGEKGPIGLKVNVACADESATGTIEFRIDCDENVESTTSLADNNILGDKYDLHNTDIESGECIAYVDVAPTGGEDTYKDIQGTLENDITGVHDLYIVFRSDNNGELFKFDYWSFEKEPEPTPVPTPTITPVPPAVSNPPAATPAPEAPKAPAKVKGLTLKKKGRKVTAAWKKVAGASKYQIVYSTDAKLKKGVKKITVKKTSTVIKKLKSKKVYYFKVRAYSSDAKKYGSYSVKKKIKL